MHFRPKVRSFLIVVGVALCLYLPLLTRNYDLNGLTEAAAVRAGTPGDLFIPNHMLYRPIGAVAYRAVQTLGWNIGIIPLLQGLSAIFGALGIGFAYLMLVRIARNEAIGFWTSLALAVSWDYWTLSTDVYYFTLAAMFVAAATAVFVYAESPGAFAVCGALAGLSVLACQYNVFLLPGLGAAILLREPVGKSVRIARLAALLGASALIVAGAFISAGIFVYGRNSIPALIQWGSSYSSNPLPMWGAWTPDRFVLVTGSAFKSVFGMDLWMFRFMHKYLSNGELPAWMAPLGCVFVTGLLVAAYATRPSKEAFHGRTATWLLVLYGIYLPFNIWWEAVEPRWFTMPNIFLAGLLAVIWSGWSKWRHFKIALPAMALLLAGFNLVVSAGPKRFVTSVPTETAACVADHMKENDLFLATEWNWAGYIDFVHNRSVLNFILEKARTGDKTKAMQAISDAVVQRQKEGGDVYMMDIGVYTPEYMKWLKDQTGLTAEDLKMYTGAKAFDCAYGSFFKLDARPASGR